MTPQDPASLEGQLSGMDDFAAVLTFRTFSGRLSAGEYDLAAVLAGLPAQELGVGGAELGSWLSQDDVVDRPCDAEISVRSARTLLLAAADCEELRPFVSEALARPDDTRLDAGLVLEFGILAGTLMMIASTDVEIRLNGVRIRKRPVSAETIKALAELLGLLRPKLPPDHDRTPKNDT